MSRRSVALLLGLSLAAAACGGGGPHLAPPAHTKAVKSSARATAETPSPAAVREPPRVPQVHSVADALRVIKRHIDVPVVLPDGLPSQMRLDGKSPLYFTAEGRRLGATLNLWFGSRTRLSIQYGVSVFDGCGADSARPVSVAGEPALLNDFGEQSALIWPATPAHPEGVYGLSGSFSPDQLVGFAASMERQSARLRSGGTAGC